MRHLIRPRLIWDGFLWDLNKTWLASVLYSTRQLIFVKRSFYTKTHTILTLIMQWVDGCHLEKSILKPSIVTIQILISSSESSSYAGCLVWSTVFERWTSFIIALSMRSGRVLGITVFKSKSWQSCIRSQVQEWVTLQGWRMLFRIRAYHPKCRTKDWCGRRQRVL